MIPLPRLRAGDPQPVGLFRGVALPEGAGRDAMGDLMPAMLAASIVLGLLGVAVALRMVAAV